MRIISIAPDVWSVRNGDGGYTVMRERVDGERRYYCSCPNFFFKKQKLYWGTCKHIKEVIDCELQRLEVERKKNG